MSDDKDYPVDMWRGTVCQSATYYAFRRQKVLPKLDDVTPEDMANFLEREKSDPTASESDRSVLRFLLHVWDPDKYSFDVGEITTWSLKELKMFANWLTDPSMPCFVYVPEMHDKPWDLESSKASPLFEEVARSWPRAR